MFRNLFGVEVLPTKIRPAMLIKIKKLDAISRRHAVDDEYN
jgi:hypothetical protein